MTIVKILVSTREGNPDCNPLIRKQVNAVKVGKWFAIHRSIDSSCKWIVTHIPSGHYMADFFSPVLAKKCAEYFNSLDIDWRRIHSNKTKAKFITSKMMNIARSKRQEFWIADDIPASHLTFPKRGTMPQ